MNWGNEQSQYKMSMGVKPLMTPGNLPPHLQPMYGPPGNPLPYNVPVPLLDGNKAGVPNQPVDHNTEDAGKKRNVQQANDPNKKSEKSNRSHKKTKWDTVTTESNWPAKQQTDISNVPGSVDYGNMMMPPPNMMPYGPPGQILPPSSIDMTGMANVPFMQSMPNIPHNMQGIPPNMPGVLPNMPGIAPNIPGIPPNMPGVPPSMAGMAPNMTGMPQNMTSMPQNMTSIPQNMPVMPQNMPGMAPNMSVMPPNMIPGMNMMMTGQPVPIVPSDQAILIGNAVLLPPLPNTLLPPKSEKPPDCKTIFVGGFPNNVTREIINEMFTRFGKVVDVKLNDQGFAQVRFDGTESVDHAFFFTGSRFRYIDQNDSESTTLFIDYAFNSIDSPTTPQLDPCTSATINTMNDKIKSHTDLSEVALTLTGWLERGECNQRNSSIFYNLIQASNDHLRKLQDERINIEKEYQAMKISFKEKFSLLLNQFELIEKILSAARQQHVYDCFSRQQKKNIDTWLKATEEVTAAKEAFRRLFVDEEPEAMKAARTTSTEKYETLKKENEKLQLRLEAHKNVILLAKEEAERRFDEYKAEFIVKQVEQAHSQIYPPLPLQPQTPVKSEPISQPKPEPPPAEDPTVTAQPVSASDAKIISAITAHLLIHPTGSSVENILSYIKIMCPFVTLGTVNHILQKYSDVFLRKKFARGGDYRWCYCMFERTRNEFK